MHIVCNSEERRIHLMEQKLEIMLKKVEEISKVMVTH